MRGLINPYTCYAVSFAVPLVLYNLGWSNLYPPLTVGVVIFVVTTIAIALAFATRLSSLKQITFNPARSDRKSPFVTTAFLYALWTAEFVHAGGVPLVKIIFGIPYDYKLFGIPSLHVFVVTFASFYTVYLFHLYLSQRRAQIFGLYLVNLFAAILIYNRGMFLFNLSATAVLYLVSRPGISFQQIAMGFGAGVVLLFLFGVLGTLRVSREGKHGYSIRNFLTTGGANDRFRNSVVPEEFFWAYIYITSPLANLQQNVSTNPVGPVTMGRVASMVNNEMMMDFISKRINAFAGLEREPERTIVGPFNVSTAYSRSYSYAGWWGVLLMATFIMAVPVLYLKIIPAGSPFFLSGFAILCSLYLFLAFDNTLRFTGLSFQLAYPVAMHVIFERIRPFGSRLS